QWQQENRQTRAMFGNFSNCNFRDVSDGLTNTVMLSETTLDIQDGAPNGGAGLWACACHVGEGVAFANPPGVTINNWYCCSWTTPPNSSFIPNKLGEFGSPGSVHSGGLNVALGDGSVRFISQNINTTTQARLGRCADGQPLGDF